jgi:hypothetical protein
MLPSVSSGTTTMPLTTQSSRPQSIAVCEATCWRPVSTTCFASSTTSIVWWSASPSQASDCAWASVMVSAQVSSRVRR